MRLDISRMATRPPMHARDSSGRNVSLLNDEPGHAAQAPASSHSLYDYDTTQSHPYMTSRSCPSSPVVPGLSRADSFDSNANDPLSPITPTSLLDFTQQSSFSASGYKDHLYNYRAAGPRTEEYPLAGQYGMPTLSSYNEVQTHQYPEAHRYEEDAHQHNAEGGPKRYPCRFRDSHSCPKTFTTSGHASRHSKIHTAEKGVSCTWEGCQKKFTRADNMKQHLETHTKERSRGQKVAINTAPLRALTVPAGVRKNTAHPISISAASSPDTVMMDIPSTLDPALFLSVLHPAAAAYRAPNALDTLALAADQSLRRG